MGTKRLKSPPVPSRRSEAGLLQHASLHLANGRHTTVSFAKVLGVSTATAFRLVQRLRRSGVPIVSVKRGRQWYYAVEDDEAISHAWEVDPLLRAVGFIPKRPPRLGDVDEIVYGRD